VFSEFIDSTEFDTLQKRDVNSLDKRIQMPKEMTEV